MSNFEIFRKKKRDIWKKDSVNLAEVPIVFSQKFWAENETETELSVVPKIKHNSNIS